MTTLSRIKLSALILLSAGTLSLRADSISGSYSNDCTGLVKLWDLSGTYNSADGSESESVVLDMDAKGAITGTGHFDVNDDADATYLHTDVNVRGKISSAGKVTRVKLTFVGTSGTGQVQGRNVTFRLTLNDSLELDGDARMLVGRSGGRITIRVPATGVTKSKPLRPSPTTENLPDEVDGAWGLSLTATPAKNKYSGSGVLQLSNGKTFDLGVTGIYASKTDLSKISLKSTDKTAPIALSVVEQNLNNSLSIHSIKGKALGQMLRFKQ